jgi:flagellar basal body P-ring formation protein FlgA
MFSRFVSAALVLGAASLFDAASVDAQSSGTARVRLSVATRALQRGETLQASDIAIVDTTIVWRWTTVSPDTTHAQPGWVTRRPIAAGEVLRAPAVSAPPAVNAGATVTVLYQDGPVRIRLSGVATNTATLGAPVGVRIDATRRFDGIAVAPNTVRLR